jgi:hypothetical protein
MYTRKSKSPKIVSCGTPDATGFVDDEFPSSTTVWVQSDMKACIHERVLLFQASINQSKISSDWKTAIVAPVFKKGDRGQPSNYRPISLSSICCKIMEHIIHSLHNDQVSSIVDCGGPYQRP